MFLVYLETLRDVDDNFRKKNTRNFDVNEVKDDRYGGLVKYLYFTVDSQSLITYKLRHIYYQSYITGH